MKISYHVTPPSYLIPLFIISSTDKVYNYTYLILFSATTGTKHIILGPILYKYHPRRFLCDVHHPMVWQNNQDIPQEKKRTAWVCCPVGPLHSLLEGWNASWLLGQKKMHNEPLITSSIILWGTQQNMVTVLKLLFIWGSIQWQQRTQQILHSPELQL